LEFGSFLLLVMLKGDEMGVRRFCVCFVLGILILLVKVSYGFSCNLFLLSFCCVFFYLNYIYIYSCTKIECEIINEVSLRV
jgi:hypothetical protein